MPSIPRVKQGQRIGQGTPVAAVSTGKARADGNTLSNLGGAISGFGKQLGAYEDAKRRVDESQFRAQANAEATLQAQKATQFATTNPDAIADGSGLQGDFGRGFQGFVDFVGGVEDNRMKNIAIQEGNRVQLKYRGKLRDLEIEKHNSAILGRADTLKNSLSLQVQNEPGSLLQVLESYDKGIVDLPFATGDNAKIQREGKKDIVLAAIQGLSSQGAFDQIREGLSNPKIVGLIKPSERKELLKTLEDEEREFSNDRYRKEDRRIGDMDRSRKEQERNITIKLLGGIVDAETPEKRNEFEKQSRDMMKNGLISQAKHRALMSTSNYTEADISTSKRAEIVFKSLRGGNPSELEQEVYAEMGKSLTHKDALGLLTQLQAQKKREAQNPSYKEEKKLADKLIRTSFTPMSQNAFGDPIWGSDQKREQINISIRAKELSDNGVAPLKAAQVALGEVLGRGASINISNIPDHIQNDPVLLTNEAKSIAERYKRASAKGIDKGVKLQTLRMLRDIKIKLKAMGVQEQMNSILKNDSALKEKVNGTAK